jgi:hypothetical protein
MAATRWLAAWLSMLIVAVVTACVPDRAARSSRCATSLRVLAIVVRELLQLSGLRPRPELRDLAERFGILP